MDLRRVPALARCLAGVALLLVSASCGEDADDTGDAPTTIDGAPASVVSDFVGGSDGWSRDVADFSDATRPEDVVSETGVEPPGLDTDAEGFFRVAATNRSDDLFLYLRRTVEPAASLEPATTYDVSFVVEVASAAPSGCAGIGGPPGEAQWLKVGASAEEPAPVEVDGDTRLAVDKGNQSQGGDAAVVAGVIANGIPCEEALAQDERPWAMVELSASLTATTGPDGTLWLFAGTDSGFEGRTDLYYDRIAVTLEPAS